jgi:hypothetical protein
MHAYTQASKQESKQASKQGCVYSCVACLLVDRNIHRLKNPSESEKDEIAKETIDCCPEVRKQSKKTTARTPSVTI